jgi:hypothetical protein
MTTVGRSLRGARATVFAVACVGLSAAGHVWMSGEAVPLWSLALAFAVLAGAGYALAGRQRGFLSISALMLVGELGQHLLFCAAQDMASASSASAASSSVPALPSFISGRVLPLSDWICGMASSASSSGMSARGDGSLGARLAADLMTGQAGRGDVGMIAAHAAAGMLCAWWLRCGEAAVFRTLRWLATLAAPALLLLWPATLVVPDFRRAAVPRDDRALGRYNRLLSTLVVRRGPPVGASLLCAF